MAEAKAAPEQELAVPKKGKIQTWEKVNKLFKVPTKSYPAKDGSSRHLMLEHRVGKAGGAYTLESLMDRLGLNDEWVELCQMFEKKLRRDPKTLQHLSDQIYKGRQSRLRSAIKTFRMKAEAFYETQGIKPLIAMVPISDKEEGLFIQAFVDLHTGALVAGDVSDAALWSETVATRCKPMVDQYRAAQQCAKKLLGRKDVNKDLAARLEQVVSGNLPPKIEFKDGGK